MAHPDKKIFWLVTGIILLKLLLLPFAQTVDADAVTRTFLSEDWLKNPVWITNSVWGPFHFYLTASVLSIWNNPIYAPVVMNIILSSVTLFPFYYFVKREFNSDGAFVATCFLAISPIIFRNSLMNMSETPYLLFITLTLNFLSKGFKSSTRASFLLAGLSTTIASGFRFEAWLFIPLFSLVILLKKEKINTVIFFIAAILYPASDLLTNFILDNYSLSHFFSSYPWNMSPGVHFFAPHLKDYLRRIWFIPFCWAISLGPPVAFITIKEIIKVQKGNPDFAWCAILFWAILLLAEVSAFRVAILLHERFAITISLLSLPFVANYFKELSNKKIRIALVFGMLTIGLTYVYNMENITLLPRLSDQNGAKVARIIEKELTPESGLLTDFWGWENTFYIELQSKLSPQYIYAFSGNSNEKNTIRSDEINTIIKNHSQGVVILVKNSLLWQNTIFTENHLQFKFNPTVLATRRLFNNDEVVVWVYSY